MVRSSNSDYQVRIHPNQNLSGSCTRLLKSISFLSSFFKPVGLAFSPVYLSASVDGAIFVHGSTVPVVCMDPYHLFLFCSSSQILRLIRHSCNCFFVIDMTSFRICSHLAFHSSSSCRSQSSASFSNAATCSGSAVNSNATMCLHTKRSPIRLAWSLIISRGLPFS